MMKLLFTFILLFGSTYSYAQTLNLHPFQFGDTLETPSMEDALGVNSELIQTQQPFLFRLSYDYTQDPLSGSNGSGSGNLSFVENLHTISLGGALRIFPRFWIGFSAPLHYIKLSQSYVSGQYDPSAWEFGDLDLHAKVRLTREQSKINIAFRPHFTLPTGDDRYFISDDSYGMGGKILADTAIDQWKFFAHAGMTYASNSQFLNIDRRSRLEFGVGAFYKISERIALNSEWIQTVPVPVKDGQNPFQLSLGFRYTAGLANIFMGGGLHSFEFSDGDRPLLFYTGMKVPLGGNKNEQSVLQNTTPTPDPVVDQAMDPEFNNAIEFLSKMIVYFDNNKSNLKAEFHDTLKKAAELIQAHRAKIQYMIIRGYTDPRGDEEYNKMLSETRAKTVKKYLVEQGLDEHFILVNGYGESALKVTVEKQYRENRRAEFEILKK